MNKNKGFTIIETLIAITILMIAIAGPLVVASKGLTGALASRDQMIASNLAQESMETVKNKRDNNLAASANWLNTISMCTPANTPCDASSFDSSIITTGTSTLSIATNSNYSHTSGSATLFKRSFHLNLPGNPASACLTTSTECIVTVVVDWNEGTVPYEVSLSSNLQSTTR